MSGVIDAFLVNADSHAEGNGIGCWHSFPTTTDELQQTLSEIGVDGVNHLNVYVARCESIYPAIDDGLTGTTNLDELNYLAIKLNDLTDSQQEQFGAAVEADRHCGSVADLINLTENLELFDLQPAFSPHEYGAFHVNLARDEHAAIMNRLETSADPAERDFFTYIAGVEAHVDLAAYGKFIAENEGGVFTEQGYLTEGSGFREAYRGLEDIPAEYRVFAYPEARDEPAHGADRVNAIYHITTEELRRTTITEGLVLQGCGGDPKEWLAGINELLTQEGILLDNDKFHEIYVFEHDGHTNILFDMEDVKLNIGKLAMWRLANHETFGGTWLSDYLPNRLGVELEERSPEPAEKPSVLGRIAAARAEREAQPEKPAPEKPPRPHGPEL